MSSSKIKNWPMTGLCCRLWTADTVSHVGIFDPALWKTIVPLSFSLAHLPLPPFQCNPGSRIPETQIHIFESLVTNFWVKSSIILWNLFLEHLKNKIINNFVKFVATKEVMTIFFHPSFSLLFLDPGWVKIRIRDKHPGSATLLYRYIFLVNFALLSVSLIFLLICHQTAACWKCSQRFNGMGRDTIQYAYVWDLRRSQIYCALCS